MKFKTNYYTTVLECQTCHKRVSNKKDLFNGDCIDCLEKEEGHDTMTQA